MEIFPSFKNNFQEHFFWGGGGGTLANSNQAEEETKVATGPQGSAYFAKK